MDSIYSGNKRLKQLAYSYQKNFFDYNYVFFSVALVIGLSTGEIIMSVASIALFINWILEGDFQEKHKRAKHLKFIPYFLILGYFSLLFWLINTSDFEYAFNDLKVKLPLFLFPLILGTIKLNKTYLLTIFRFFILGTLFSTFISFLVYLEFIPIEKSIEDVRNISVFISHIRLSLLVCFSIVILVLFTRKKAEFFNSFLSLFLVFWFVFFLFVLQAFTGLFILIAFSFLFIFNSVYQKKNKAYSVFLIFIFGSLFFISLSHINTIFEHNFIPKPIDPSTLDKKTELGEVYQHRLEDNWLENGNRVWLYVAPIELKKSWNQRSEVPFEGLDNKGQPVWGTLYRFLTSKGFRKDKKGLLQLTDNEVKMIENGETNCCEKLTGLDKRIKDVFFQYERFKKGQNPNGHSITQRFIYLKASLNLLKSNLLFGVGLGDVHDEFMAYYDSNNSKLIGKNRKRVHNQYFVFAVGLGITGLTIWLVLLYFPFFKLQQNKELYFYFLLIISISFLTDNTLERQAGVMFFSFFNSLLLFQNTPREL
jgi:hypothetical protein